MSANLASSSASWMEGGDNRAWPRIVACAGRHTCVEDTPKHNIMNSFLSERTTRVALLSLLALGAYTEVQACPCGCVKVCVDNLADRPVAAAGAYSVDFRYDIIDQDERNSGAHAHFLAYHRILTGTIETQLGGQPWSIALPRINRIVRSNIAPTVPIPNPVNTRQEVVGLGDVSLSTRFAWSDYNVIAGVKLPFSDVDEALGALRERTAAAGVCA